MDPSIPIGTALMLGSYAVASDVLISEPAGDGRDRMTTAVEALAAQLKVAIPDFFVSGDPTDVSTLFDGAQENHRQSFLVEMTIANPFAPHWFEMSKERTAARLHGLRQVAKRSLKLETDCVAVIDSCWKGVLSDEQPIQWRKWAQLGAGSLAAAALLAAAGPLIAPLMPAAAGLGGAAAVSAGLAQLGFGSIAAGGLGMTGGLWMLGLAGGALGAGGTAASQQMIVKAVEEPGGEAALQGELRKLLLSARLAKESGWFGRQITQFDEAADVIAGSVGDQLELEKSRNDPRAPRVVKLKELDRTATFVGEEMRKLNSGSDG